MPEEKKVQTFGFTRDDIKEIARGEVIEYADDVIKKAIDDGDIEIPEELPATTEASEGDVLKLDASKNPVWAAASGGGTKLYIHKLNFTDQTTPYPTTYYLYVVSERSEAYTSWGQVVAQEKNFIQAWYNISGQFVVYATTAGSNLQITYVNGTTLTSVTSNVEEITDTVTEL